MTPTKERVMLTANALGREEAAEAWFKAYEEKAKATREKLQLKGDETANLINMMENIRSQVLAYRSFISSYKFRSTFMEEHWEIFHAIKNREPEKAEELMKKHILTDCEAIASQIGNTN